jgi:hypothetical protein
MVGFQHLAGGLKKSRPLSVRTGDFLDGKEKKRRRKIENRS